MGNGPLQLMAIALFAVTGLAAANPMAKFVDCSDSFWAIACEVQAEPAIERGDWFTPASDGSSSSADLVGTNDAIRIDNDSVCVVLDSGFTLCETT